MMKYNLKQFDTITRFRLINSFLVTVSLSILSPVLIILKGTYMLPYMISIFSIFYIISAKTNKYLVPLGNKKLYKMGIISHLILIMNTCLYFYNPEVMIYLDAGLMFFIGAIFSAYSISLTNYITQYYPDSVPEFQITRNNMIADSSIIGLVLSTGCLSFSIKYSILLFVVYNLCFSLYMIYNWNFFDKYEILDHQSSKNV